MYDGHAFLIAFYVGINIENILYGIELLLYFKTIRILLGKGTHKKSNLLYALFSTVMVLSTTVWVATQALFGQKAWLLNADFPGGPYAYWKTNISVWYMEWGRVEIVVLQLMTDALMIHRCRMIWDSNRIVVLPIIMWLTTFTLGILLAWVNSAPGVDFHTGISARFSLAYWSTSVFLNTTLTCMICYRVVRHGKVMQEHLGPEFASLYFSVATIVVESVLPYTLSGIAFLVSLGVGSPTFGAFVAVYVLMMCISPQMLILRVIAGEAWSNDTFTRPTTTLNFTPDTSGSHVQTQSSVFKFLSEHDKASTSQV